MSQFTIEVTDDALEDLRRLDGAPRKAALAKMLKMQDSRDPAQMGKPLTPPLAGSMRLTFLKKAYRIIYKVDSASSVCTIWVVGARKDDAVYREAEARVSSLPAAVARPLDQALSLLKRARRT